MSTWWYEDKTKKQGPVEAKHLAYLLRTGKIGAQTLVWKEGMASWEAASDVTELNTLVASLPVHLSNSHTFLTIGDTATHWPRFFARMIDYYLSTYLAGWIVAGILHSVLPLVYDGSYVEWKSTIAGILNHLIPSILLGFVIDALFYRIFGNTLAKALLGLKVVDLDGKPLSFWQYLRRNFSVLIFGMGLLIPLLAMIPLVRQARRLISGKQTSYDESNGWRLTVKPSYQRQRVGFIFIFLCIFSVQYVLNHQEVEREKLLQTTALSVQTPYSWENPLTRKTISIDPRWKLPKTAAPGGQSLFMFTESTNRAFVFLGMETFPGASLEDYLAALQASLESKVHFNDRGRLFEQQGERFWKGEGKLIENPDMRVSLQIIQIGNSFWRVQAVQALPYAFSDGLVAELQARLWDTVPLQEQKSEPLLQPEKANVL